MWPHRRVRARARGRSGAAPRPCRPARARMISHMISSIPSVPASRRNSSRVILRSSSGSVGQLVEEGVVELGVDQPGALALELVAHAAGAPDLHVEARGIGAHRVADRCAELPAALGRRRRELGDVDRQRDHPHRPLLDLAEHQRQRHGQAVIDVHRVHQRQVELVDHQLLGEVRGEHRIAHHHRHRALAPAFVGGLELLGHAERERRHDVEHHRAGMVVVAQDDDVGLFVPPGTP